MRLTVERQQSGREASRRVRYRRGHWLRRADVFVEENGTPPRDAPLPAPQSETVALAHEDRVHLIGGRTPKNPSASRWDEQRDADIHRVFEPQTATWSTARPIPGVRNSAGGAVIDGALYVLGGRTMEGGNIDPLDRYDPSADRWDGACVRDRALPEGWQRSP